MLCHSQNYLDNVVAPTASMNSLKLKEQSKKFDGVFFNKVGLNMIPHGEITIGYFHSKGSNHNVELWSSLKMSKCKMS